MRYGPLFSITAGYVRIQGHTWTPSIAVYQPSK